MKGLLKLIPLLFAFAISGCSIGHTTPGGENPPSTVEAKTVQISGVNTLRVGDAATLGVIISPEGAADHTITWASSNTEVATISSKGEVGALSEGTTYITAKVDSITSNPFLITVNPAPVTTYTITFNTNGGSSVASQTVNSGETIERPEDPIKTGYTFVNWYTDKECTILFDFNKGITGSFTLYAKWNANRYTVTFNSNGGSSVQSQSVYYGEKVVKPTNPTKQDYTFGGWYTDSALTKAYDFDTTITGNLTLYAKWNEGGQSGGEEDDLDSWTIMIYMCGSDLESGNDGNGNYNPSQYGGFATADIKEILSVSGQPDDINIIIETGGAGKWSSKYGISNTKLGRYHVANKQLVKDAQLTNASMGESETFQSFLEWGLTTYPAEKTGIILWNHGGAMGGVCSDEKFDGDTLLNSETKLAFKNAFKNANVEGKLEFIGYDACLMQVQDIADFNSQYFNYMIGAEESEAGEGWDYDSWVDDLYAKKETTQILRAICDGFVSTYSQNYPQYDNDQTLSYLDLSKMANYREKFEALAASMTSVVKTKAFTTFMKTVKNYGDSWIDEETYDYYLDNGYYDASMFSPNTEVEDGITYYLLYGYYDFGSFDVKDFLNKLNSNSTLNVNKTNVANALSALNEVILYNKKGGQAGNSNGLAFICPMDTWGSNNFYNSNEETNFVTWRGAVTANARVYDN